MRSVWFIRSHIQNLPIDFRQIPSSFDFWSAPKACSFPKNFRSIDFESKFLLTRSAFHKLRTQSTQIVYWPARASRDPYEISLWPMRASLDPREFRLFLIHASFTWPAWYFLDPCELQLFVIHANFSWPARDSLWPARPSLFGRHGFYSLNPVTFTLTRADTQILLDHVQSLNLIFFWSIIC